MASYTNRAPSPLSRPNNPNPRNSESNSGTRRSFSGHPISRPSIHTKPRSFCPSTPANSPSDFARRRSVGNDGPIAVKECEEKENNEKDHNSKAAKIRSPVIGSKNFMSPTISAASKFTPSPRKKVLVERNDPFRTSISLSDGKAIFFSANHEPAEPKSDMDMDQNKVELARVSDMVEKKAVTEGPLVSKPLKKVTFSEVPSPSENGQESTSNSVIIDSGCCDENMISCSSKPSTIAPLDADPSMPPYDPKTNYLAPRPQFLRYKPNTRIEILLNKENGLDSDGFKKLEESFMSEIMSGNTSDSDGTEESSQKEVSEDASSVQLEQGVDEKEEDTMLGEDDLVLGIDEKELESEVTGSTPISTADTDAISEENFEAKRDETSLISPRLKWVSLLLVFLIACASILVTDSPVTPTSMLTDLSFSNLYHQSRAAAFAKWNVDGFVRNVNQYSVNSLSYISKLITDLGRVDDRLGTLMFMNLTDLQKEIMIGDLFVNKELSREFEENEMEKDLPTEFQELEEEESSEANYDEATGEEIEEVSDKLEENEVEGVLDTELQEFQEKVSAEFDLDQIVEKETEVVPPAPATLFTEVEPNSNQESIQNEVEIVPDMVDEQKNDRILEDQLAIVPLAQETQNAGVTIEVKPEIIETKKIEADIELDHKSLSETDSLNQGIQSAQVLESTFSRVACKSEAYIVEGSCAVIALLGAAAFFYWNQRTSPSSGPVTGIGPLLTKKAISGLAAGGSVGVQHVDKEKPQSSHNWTAEDVVGVSSCPSEMSSFEKSWSSCSKKEQKVTTSEAQSHERKARGFSKRESMASSVEYSSESPSYGSFTTYERIPIKHVNGEEEIITPVRRSSRLRSQVTSQ